MTHRKTIKQLAQAWGKPVSTVTTWARVYRWPCIKLGKTRFFDEGEVDRHMKSLGFARA